MDRLEFEKLALYDKLDVINQRGKFVTRRKDMDGNYSLFTIDLLLVETFYSSSLQENLQSIYTVTETEAIRLYVDLPQTLGTSMY
jgi:hypothetical protein